MTVAQVMGLPPDLVLAFVLLDIVIILIVARLCGHLATKVGQPRVVGEIIAGILLGPSLLGPKLLEWTNAPSFLHCDQSILAAPEGTVASITTCLFPQQARGVLGIIGQIALIFFMFLVGVELDFSLLKNRGKAIAILGVGAVVIPIGVGLVIGPLLYNDTFLGTGDPSTIAFSLFLASMLSVTAFPVMARILQEKNMSATAMGAIGVAAAAVVTVLMFLTLAVASGVSSQQGPDKLGVKFVIAGIFIALLFYVGRPLLERHFAPRYRAAGSLTPGMFAFLLILLFAGAYTADRIGINVIVGGFLIGAILPERKDLFRDVASRLADLTIVILLPIFLAFSGLATDFTKLSVAAIPGLALFLVAGIACKWGGGAVSAKLAGLSWAEGNLVGILMNCRGLLVLVVGLIAFNQGVISPGMQIGGVLMALVTTAMTGPLFDRFVGSVTPPDADQPPPPTPGARRVLVAIDDLDRAPLVVRAAYSLVHERPAEVTLARLFRPTLYGGSLADVAEGEGETVTSLRALRQLADWPPDGVTVVPVARASSDPATDLAALAREREVDLVVVDLEGPLNAHAASGKALHRLLRSTEATVVASWIPDDAVNLHAAAPAAIAGDGPGSALPPVVAGLLGPGVELEQVADDGLVDAASRSSAVVVLGDDRNLRGVVARSESLIPAAPCPVHIVWPGTLVPAAAGPPTA